MCISTYPELPAYSERSYSPGSGQDSFEPWLHQNDHLYAGRAHLRRNQAKTKKAVYAKRDSYAAEHGYNLDQIYADLKRREASGDPGDLTRGLWRGVTTNAAISTILPRASWS